MPNKTFAKLFESHLCFFLICHIDCAHNINLPSSQMLLSMIQYLNRITLTLTVAFVTDFIECLNIVL